MPAAFQEPHSVSAPAPTGADTPSWHVMAAYRREIQAERELADAGFEVFLPKVEKTVKLPHRRPRVVEVPAVATYVFLRATRADIVEYKRLRDNRLKFCTDHADPAGGCLVVPDRAMDAFRRLWAQRSARRVDIGPAADIPAGTRVRITAGPLTGLEGTYVGPRGRRAPSIVIQLPGLLHITTLLADTPFEPVTEPSEPS